MLRGVRAQDRSARSVFGRFSVAVALCTAAVLGVTLMSPIESAVAAPGWDVPDAPVPPALELPPIEVPEGDFTELPVLDAADLALAQEPEVVPAPEVPELDAAALIDENIVERGEFETVYDLGDGYRVSELSLEPINVEVGGEWVDVETAVARVDDEAFGVENHPLTPEFAETADATNAFRIADGQYSVGFTLLGLRRVR